MKAGLFQKDHGMYCTHCGNALPGDARFCPRCGKEMKFFSPGEPEEEMFGFEPENPEMNDNRYPERAYATDRPTNWLWVLYSALICLGVGVVLRIVFSLILSSAGNPSVGLALFILLVAIVGILFGPGLAAYHFPGRRAREPVAGAMGITLLGILLDSEHEFPVLLAGLLIAWLLNWLGAKIGLSMKEKKLRAEYY